MARVIPWYRADVGVKDGKIAAVNRRGLEDDECLIEVKDSSKICQGAECAKAGGCYQEDAIYASTVPGIC